MSALEQTRYTPEQYLEMDRKAEHRSEYVNGEILAMAGASRVHNLVVTNLVREISLALRGRPCETYSNDMRVQISATRYSYPDIVVGCEPRFIDGQLDTLLNPVVIMEVLSPTTAKDDRSWKFAHCRRLETLTEYVMLSQFQPFAEQYTREENGRWVLTEVAGLGAVLRLPAVGCDLPLAAVYERVEFTPDPEMPALEFWSETP